MSETVTLTVHGAFYRGDAITRRSVTAEKKENLLTALKRNGLYLRDCGGNGSCGKCRVRFLGGAPLPTITERALFSAEQLRAGFRLACRHTVEAPAELILESEAAAVPGVLGAEEDMPEASVPGAEEDMPEASVPGVEKGTSAVHVPGAEEDMPEASVPGAEKNTAAVHVPGMTSADGAARKADAPFFAAVDIGTTTVAMRGVCGSELLGAYYALNPQRIYGADVISRINAGIHGHAKEMRRMICRCLADGLRLIGEQCGRRPEYMVIAANTTMVHLLCGYPLEPLAAYPFRSVDIKPQEIVVAGIPAYIICGFSTFVGGDIVSGMVSLGLHKSSDLQLFIDLGTNGELLLGKKGRFLCTAVSAGPAFEGNVSADLMGADLIRIAAELLDEGVMDGQGLLREPYFEEGIDRAGTHIRQADIRELQKAKAAIAAGIEILLERYGARAEDVRSVFLAGGFGHCLDPSSALRIGLMPQEFAGKIKAVGNAALRGACLLGNADMQNWEERTVHLADDCISQNLAALDEFEEKYIAHLDFPT